MPAMLDDPTSPAIHRPPGLVPPLDPGTGLPYGIKPRQVILRDRVTVATLVPFHSLNQVPPTLVAYLCDQLNREIEKGDTYPMIDPMPISMFGPYWFAKFGAIMLLGKLENAEDVVEGKNWGTECLGSFYIKPNYPGRSSHVCNGGFLVTDAARGRGVGRLMGEGYLSWAPMLGYSYSVFNLVYETNVASIRIWDGLGFKRIGRVKGCGSLASHPDTLIDAIIYGRDLDPESEDYVTEERFDKIRYYLKYSKYPETANRAEKSRLRSAAVHYRLEGEKLFLKDKEVISDPQQQYEIAQAVHQNSSNGAPHGGINKTTAAIAEHYHWVRIKETVLQVIRNCETCREAAKAPATRTEASPLEASMQVSDSDSHAAVKIASRFDNLPVDPTLLDNDDHLNMDTGTNPSDTATSPEMPMNFDWQESVGKSLQLNHPTQKPKGADHVSNESAQDRLVRESLLGAGYGAGYTTS